MKLGSPLFRNQALHLLDHSVVCHSIALLNTQNNVEVIPSAYEHWISQEKENLQYNESIRSENIKLNILDNEDDVLVVKKSSGFIDYHNSYNKDNILDNDDDVLVVEKSSGFIDYQNSYNKDNILDNEDDVLVEVV